MFCICTLLSARLGGDFCFKQCCIRISQLLPITVLYKPLHQARLSYHQYFLPGNWPLPKRKLAIVSRCFIWSLTMYGLVISTTYRRHQNVSTIATEFSIFYKISLTCSASGFIAKSFLLLDRNGRTMCFKSLRRS